MPLGRVVVADQAKRWGSCSRGIVRLNWRILQAPRPLVDYVIAHELVHLAHPDHGRAFWRALGVGMPDYDARRARLRGLGPALGLVSLVHADLTALWSFLYTSCMHSPNCAQGVGWIR